MSETTRESEARPFVFIQGRVIALEVSTTAYSLPAILRTCYKLADRLHSFVSPTELDAVYSIMLWSRVGGDISEDLIGEFTSELADQELRERLAREAGPIREMIVAQAFAEGTFTEEPNESDYEADPLGIAEARQR